MRREYRERSRVNRGRRNTLVNRRTLKKIKRIISIVGDGFMCLVGFLGIVATPVILTAAYLLG